MQTCQNMMCFVRLKLQTEFFGYSLTCCYLYDVNGLVHIGNALHWKY